MVTILLLALSSFAHAAENLPSLRVDLDGDGKPDLVRLVHLSADHERLVIELTKNGARLAYDTIAKHFANDDKHGCQGIGSHALRDTGNGTFEWIQTSREMDACGSVGVRTLRLRLAGNDLHVEKAALLSDEWHMGDNSPVETTTYDFADRKIAVDSDDHHVDQPKHAEEAMRAGCDLTLGQFEKAQGEIPACAAVPASFMMKEIDVSYPPEAAPCPELHGTYACKLRYDGGTENVRKVAIARTNTGVNVYDLAGEQAPLVADGQMHELILPAPNFAKLDTTTTCKRETLRTVTASHGAQYDDGTPPKRTYPTRPEQIVTTEFTQLDVPGARFHIVETTKIGDFEPIVHTLDCVRIP
jgi:hypothetical protein